MDKGGSQNVLHFVAHNHKVLAATNSPSVRLGEQ
jgi:hypothetical protein